MAALFFGLESTSLALLSIGLARLALLVLRVKPDVSVTSSFALLFYFMLYGVASYAAESGIGGESVLGDVLLPMQLLLLEATLDRGDWLWRVLGASALFGYSLVLFAVVDRFWSTHRTAAPASRTPSGAAADPGPLVALWVRRLRRMPRFSSAMLAAWGLAMLVAWASIRTPPEFRPELAPAFGLIFRASLGLLLLSSFFDEAVPGLEPPQLYGLAGPKARAMQLLAVGAASILCAAVPGSLLIATLGGSAMLASATAGWLVLAVSILAWYRLMFVLSNTGADVRFHDSQAGFPIGVVASLLLLAAALTRMSLSMGLLILASLLIILVASEPPRHNGWRLPWW